MATPVPWWFAGPAAIFAEMRAAATNDGHRSFLSREFVDVVRFGRFVGELAGLPILGEAQVERIVRRGREPALGRGVGT